MNRVQKQQQVEELKQVSEQAACLVFSGIEGMNAEDTAKLRCELRETGSRMKVFKNTVAHITFQDSDLAVLQQDLSGSTAVIWNTQDAVAPAKICVRIAKELESLKIKSGYHAGKRLDSQEVKTLASLPSLDELRGNILGLLQAVPSKLLSQLNAPATHVLLVMQARHDKEAKSGSTGNG